MKSKHGWILIGVLFIFEGIISLLGYKVFSKYHGWVNISTIGSLYLLIIGILFIVYGYNKKEKEQNYSKCPKCKEIFQSNDLENGKCKYCKDIETIDLDKYFELSPKELTKRKKGNSQK